MPLLKEGEVAPALSLSNQDGATVDLGSYQGRYVLLWWYPKADTPG